MADAINILGISGAKGSGKTTVANLVKRWLATHRRVDIISLAEPLKDLCRNLFNVPRDLLHGTEEQKNQDTSYRWADLDSSIPRPKVHGEFVTGRQMMQVVGGHLRLIHADCWARRMVRVAAEELRTGVSIVIVDDVRYKNELKIIQDVGGKVVRLEREGLYRNRSNSSDDDHPSEMELGWFYTSGWFDAHIGSDEDPSRTAEQTAGEAIGLLREWGWLKGGE